LGLAALDRTAPPGQRPDSTCFMRDGVRDGDRGDHRPNEWTRAALVWVLRPDAIVHLIWLISPSPFRGASARAEVVGQSWAGMLTVNVAYCGNG
jgi:hypothetical protein